MLPPVEDRPWYPAWRKAVERVIAARRALDGTAEDAPEREAAERELQAARSAYMLIANRA